MGAEKGPGKDPVLVPAVLPGKYRDTGAEEGLGKDRTVVPAPGIHLGKKRIEGIPVPGSAGRDKHDPVGTLISPGCRPATGKHPVHQGLQRAGQSPAVHRRSQDQDICPGQFLAAARSCHHRKYTDPACGTCSRGLLCRG